MSSPMIGWRFRPTNEELVTQYLKPKTLGHDHVSHVIGELNFCDFEPWDLPDMAKIKSHDPVWYFLSPRDRKYKGGKLCNRKTKAGFWKSTGKHIPVKAKRTKKEIGLKKTLVFHQGSFKEKVRTGWILHEYELIRDPDLPVQKDFVLCKLKKKPLPCEQVASSSDFEGEPISSISNTMELTNESCCVESGAGHAKTFTSENPSSSELSANSACTEIRPSQLMASEFGNQDSSKMVVSSADSKTETRHQMVSDFTNQNSNSNSKITYNSSQVDYDSENHISLLDFEGECGAALSFNLQSPCGGGKLGGLVAPDCENVRWSPMIELPSDLNNVSLHGNKGESCDLMASDFGNQNQGDDILRFLVEISSPMGFDFGNQNQDKNINVSAFEEGEWCSLVGTPPDISNPSPCNKEEMNSLLASDFGHQNQDKNADISCLFFKTSSEMASDFGDQSQDKNNDISAFQEREFLRAMPSHFEDQNLGKMTEMSVSEDNIWSYLLNSVLENGEAEDFFLKINPQPVAELEATSSSM